MSKGPKKQSNGKRPFKKGSFQKKGKKQMTKMEYLMSVDQQNKNSALKKSDFNSLGVVSSTGSSTTISQQNVVEIKGKLLPDQFASVAAAWSLFAIKNSVDNTPIDIEGNVMSGQIGPAYIMYAGILYDLYLSTQNQQTMFSFMPRKYKELRDTYLPKVKGRTSYAWVPASKCFGSGGLYPILQPYVEFASMSWMTPSGFGALNKLYDFTASSPVILDDQDVYNCFPPIIQRIWTGLNKRINLDLLTMSDLTGYENCVGAFSHCIDNSSSSNLGWVLSTIEEQVPNSMYWTRFLGVYGIPDDSNNSRTGIHVFADYVGPHHYACHLEGLDFDPTVGRCVKTIYRYKVFCWEEMASYLLTMLFSSDLFFTNQSTSLNPVSVDPSVFANMNQAHFLRYALIVMLTRFSQAGWTGYAFKTCETQYTMVAGVNLTPYSEVYNIPVPRALSEFFGSVGSKISTFYKSQNKVMGGKAGRWRFVNIPVMAVYGNTLGNVYQNQSYSASQTDEIASSLLGILRAVNPNIDLSVNYGFNPTIVTSLPQVLKVIGTTQETVNTSQVSGTQVIACMQIMGNNWSVMNGYIDLSTAIANKDDFDFTSLYYTRGIEEPEPFAGGYSSIYNSLLTSISNRVWFDQRIFGGQLATPLPQTCMNLQLHQTIYNENSLSTVSNASQFFLVTLRSAQQFVHPKESGSGTTDFSLMDASKVMQHRSGNMIKMMGDGLKMISPMLGKILGDYIPGGEELVEGLAGLIPGEN